VGLSVGVRWRPVGTAMNGTVVARRWGQVGFEPAVVWLTGRGHRDGS
jgi:hypothetical protein